MVRVAAVYGTKETGLVLYSAQVRADSTAASIQELLKELKDYSHDGMTDEELAFMRLAVGQQDALKYETPSQSQLVVFNFRLLIE